jgi:1-phosphatidylinositol-3-phosphate 5-kinase
VSLNVVPPSDSQQSDGMTSSNPDSPQISYTIPTARRPGTVPQMAIPATRMAIGTSGRHTAVEIPTIDTAPSSRPQSSRSNTGIQIGRKRSQSFGTQIGGRPRSNSIPLEETYSRAPFHQNMNQNMNEDEMMSQDASGDAEDLSEDFLGEETYAPVYPRREGVMEGAAPDWAQQDHLKPPTPLQRNRSMSKPILDERFRSNKRRSLQNIQRRSRSKSRGHRGSLSVAGDYFRGGDLPPSPIASSSSQIVPPSSPIPIVGDLSQLSISHVQKLLTQMLSDEGIENVDTWQRVLMPILLKIADSMDPDVRGMGDDIDVRSYVKIKRLPGGTEADSTYVSGVVFSKNLSLKRMPRTVPNPRIMLVTFPIEYHHNELQLMSLDPMIAQGKDYTHNLVMRIMNHRPSVLVIGSSVSGMALEYLLQYNVSTLHNVKPSVIEALSRCCQADIISSIDKLSSNPELGTCGQFSVRTSIHDLIPGNKKTLVYLNGCPEDLGCTVVLRGADMETLGRVKRVLDFMVYVAYNLKLETSLMYDNMINIPNQADSEEEPTTRGPSEQESETTVYDDAIRKFRNRIISASPCVSFPPPELLTKARNSEISVNRLRLEHARTLATQGEAAPEDQTEQSNTTSELPDAEKVLSEPKSPPIVPSKENCQVSYQQRVDNLLHEYRHNRAIQELALRHRQWEDFKTQSPNLMNPLAHQAITVLYSNLQKKTSVPCQGPDIHIIDFYSESDCTLGQYVEDLFMCKEGACEDCEKLQYEHVRNYVHNHGRMNVFIEKHPCPLPGMHQSILMWSWCSLCELTLNVSRMSENSYRYSFGKWLELAFYAKDLKHRGGSCPHDVNRYHVRYFGYDNWAVRFQYDTVDVLSLVVPDMRFSWDPEGDVRLKAKEKSSISAKIKRFFDSVGDRWKSISMENVTPEKQDACKAEVARFLGQVQSQRESLFSTLERIWDESMVLDRLPLNRVLKDLQDYVVQWDTQFTEFEKNFLPSDKDIRRLTAMQLRKIVGDSGLPFMDVLERKSSATTSETPPPEEKAGTAANSETLEKGRTIDIGPDERSQSDTSNLGSVQPIEVPQQRNEEDTSPSIQPSSVDSRVSELSEIDPERRALPGPKTLSVAPKIARLQAEIISPAASPMRQPVVRSTTIPGPPTGAPDNRSRNLSAQSSESEDGSSPTENRKDRSTLRPTIPATKIPKLKPPQGLTPIHGKSKSSDSTSESRHKSRNPSEDTTDRSTRTKPHKQFMSNTIKKLQRVTGTNPSVHSLAKHFDELSRQYENEEIKRRKRFGYRRAFPVTSAKPKVEVFSNVQDAVLEASDDEAEIFPVSVGHSRKSTMKGPEDIPSEAIRDQQTSENASIGSTELDIPESDRPAEGAVTDIPSSPAEVVGDVVAEMANPQGSAIILPAEEIPGSTVPPEDTKESVSIMKAITNLWADRSAALWKPLEYPLYDLYLKPLTLDNLPNICSLTPT